MSDKLERYLKTVEWRQSLDSISGEAETVVLLDDDVPRLVALVRSANRYALAAEAYAYGVDDAKWSVSREYKEAAQAFHDAIKELPDAE